MVSSVTKNVENMQVFERPTFEGPESRAGALSQIPPQSSRTPHTASTASTKFASKSPKTTHEGIVAPQVEQKTTTRRTHSIGQNLKYFGLVGVQAQKFVDGAKEAGLDLNQALNGYRHYMDTQLQPPNNPPTAEQKRLIENVRSLVGSLLSQATRVIDTLRSERNGSLKNAQWILNARLNETLSPIQDHLLPSAKFYLEMSGDTEFKRELYMTTTMKKGKTWRTHVKTFVLNIKTDLIDEKPTKMPTGLLGNTSMWNPQVSDMNHVAAFLTKRVNDGSLAKSLDRANLRTVSFLSPADAIIEADVMRLYLAVVALQCVPVAGAAASIPIDLKDVVSKHDAIISYLKQLAPDLVPEHFEIDKTTLHRVLAGAGLVLAAFGLQAASKLPKVQRALKVLKSQEGFVRTKKLLQSRINRRLVVGPPPATNYGGLPVGERFNQGGNSFVYSLKGDPDHLLVINKALDPRNKGGVSEKTAHMPAWMDERIDHTWKAASVIVDGSPIGARITSAVKDADGRTIGFVIEKFKGVELQELIRRGNITPKQLKSIETKIRKQLAMLHSKGLNHGDPNFENILVNPKTLEHRFIDFEPPTKGATEERNLDMGIIDRSFGDAYEALKPEALRARVLADVKKASAAQLAKITKTALTRMHDVERPLRRLVLRVSDKVFDLGHKGYAEKLEILVNKFSLGRVPRLENVIKAQKDIGDVDKILIPLPKGMPTEVKKILLEAIAALRKEQSTRANELVSIEKTAFPTKG